MQKLITKFPTPKKIEPKAFRDEAPQGRHRVAQVVRPGSSSWGGKEEPAKGDIGSRKILVSVRSFIWLATLLLLVPLAGCRISGPWSYTDGPRWDQQINVLHDAALRKELTAEIDRALGDGNVEAMLQGGVAVNGKMRGFDTFVTASGGGVRFNAKTQLGGTVFDVEHRPDGSTVYHKNVIVLPKRWLRKGLLADIFNVFVHRPGEFAVLAHDKKSGEYVLTELGNYGKLLEWRFDAETHRWAGYKKIEFGRVVYEMAPSNWGRVPGWEHTAPRQIDIRHRKFPGYEFDLNLRLLRPKQKPARKLVPQPGRLKSDHTNL